MIDGVDRQLFFSGDQQAAQSRVGFAAEKRHLLFVGNLVPVKGLDVLLTACRQLPAAIGPWQLHVVGEGPLRRPLEAQARSLGLENHLQFHGAIAHTELPDWFRAADLLVLASRSEGVPNVLLEAAACELPFVASDVGGIPEIAGLGQSRLAPPDNPAALANAIADMLRSARASHMPGPRDRREAVADIAAFLEACIGQRREFVTSQTPCADDTRAALSGH